MRLVKLFLTFNLLFIRGTWLPKWQLNSNFVVAKLKVLVALATVSVTILSPVYVVERLSDLVSIWLTDKLTDWWADLLIE